MRFFRIGDKVVSRDKLVDEITAILAEREAGATQEETAKRHNVQRSFVSFLETLGEIRRGARVALIGFPVANCGEVQALAEKHALDFVLVFSQAEREGIESESATEVFNSLLDTLATLRDYDVLVMLASDLRIKTIEKILGREVVGLPLGQSPLREDIVVDIEQLDSVLEGVMAVSTEDTIRGRMGTALREAADEIAGRWSASSGRWTSSRKS
ncbi:MAG: transcriptional regulator [Coriobacteriia bacterium]|nr:transcriptional regulator [Coriobacteriia bacterium]